MIKLENAEIGMKVLTNDFKGGIISNLWLSDANRPYADIDLEDGQTISKPLGLLTRLDKNKGEL